MTHSSFLQALRTVLSYHRNCGIQTYAESEGLRNSLRALDNLAEQETAEKKELREKPDDEMRGEVDPLESHGRGALSCSSGTSGLSAQIAVCRQCDLHQTRVVPTAGSWGAGGAGGIGGAQPALLIVGDWLSVLPERSPGQSELFGHEQDRMLANMVNAIALDSAEVFVTNLIKCSVPLSIRPNRKQMETCSRYLKEQIISLSPRLICAMGSGAAQMLTGTSRALSQLRGKFHPCRLPTVDAIPVMPTYHPSYLLKNPEMKQAAWSDLQAIQRELKRS